jgi:cytochrome c-type biogenesis protein CcmH/NrfG
MHRYRQLLLFSLACTAPLLILSSCSRTPEVRYARAIEKGKKLLAEKEYARAALEFQNAVQAKPKSVEALYLLGETA